MKILGVLVAVIVFAFAGAAAFIWSGIYDVSATDQHLPPTYWAIHTTMRRSVARRADDIPVPPLGAAAQLERGLEIFRAHCVQCHGAPGVAPEPFALALRPLATPLARTGRDASPAYMFWIVKHGIKMTAMPSWEFRMSDDDIWAVVAFTQRLPRLTPMEYRALSASPYKSEAAMPASDPDPARGKKAIEQYACVGCHQIPGVVGPEARLGPTLHGIGSRLTLGGVLPNSPENMVRWIRTPQEVTPLTAMPNLGVTERDARDMAAYLDTLK